MITSQNSENAAEEIPSADTVSRAVTTPQCEINLQTHLIKNMFVELSKGESLIWRKYAKEDATCHQIGMRLNSGKRTYQGFANSNVGSIRKYKNKNGHGFKVEHYPPDGKYHTHVYYDLNPQFQVLKAEKSDLKLALNDLFGRLVTIM